MLIKLTREYLSSSHVSRKLLRLGLENSKWRKDAVDAYIKHLSSAENFIKLQNSIHSSNARINDTTRTLDPIIFPQFVHYAVNHLNTVDSSAILGRLQSLTESADMREPVDWFPEARQLDRKLILHVGPTNSGKTHQALMRLKDANSGLYCGPLRLLAHEIFFRMNHEWKVPCALVTGEERRDPPEYLQNNVHSDTYQPSDFEYHNLIGLKHPKHTASTVEMANLAETYDVAVLDEIQMISEPERGWAWTSALLGLKAKEIHCCGEESAVPLLKSIASSLGEDLTVYHYNRLNPLELDKSMLKNGIKDLRKGDCVIAFSRSEIFNLKTSIESAHPKVTCAVVYGGLPPESRAEQARLFNERESGNGYDIMVASDAVGMGLNLNIKRVVFTDMEKFNGSGVDLILPRAVKQIAGRAGRFSKTAIDAEPGLATCMNKYDMIYLKKCLKVPLEPLRSACLSPTVDVLKAYAQQSPLKHDRFSKLLQSFEEMALLDSKYFLSDFETKKTLADAIEHLPLSFEDRFQFINAPVKKTQSEEMKAFVEMAHGYGLKRYYNSRVNDNDFFFKGSTLMTRDFDIIGQEGLQLWHISMYRRLFGPQSSNFDHDEFQSMVKTLPIPETPSSLLEYESMHRICVVYMWLHQRYSSEFSSPIYVNDLKTQLEKLINQSLLKISQNQKDRRKRRKKQLAALLDID